VATYRQIGAIEMRKSTQASVKAQLRKLTAEQRGLIVTALVDKAFRIIRYNYTTENHPGDDYLWAGDLLRAAGLIQRLKMSRRDLKAASIADCCRFDALSQSEAEEIKALGIDAICGIPA
jgi:hypothetical protein